MKVFGLLILSFLSSLGAQAYDAKEGNVSAMVGPFMYKTNFEETRTGAESIKMGSPFIMAIGDISDHGSLELGIFYMNKTFFLERSGKYVAEKTQLLHVTMGYRRWWTHYLSTSLSFFSAYPMAEVQLVHNDFALADTPDTSAHQKVIYGGDFAVQSDLWISGRYTVTADVRYSHSFTTQKNEFGDHYGVALALRYFIQEKQHAAKPPPQK